MSLAKKKKNKKKIKTHFENFGDFRWIGSLKSFNLCRFFRWAIGSRGGGTCPKCPPPLDTRLTRSSRPLIPTNPKWRQPPTAPTTNLNRLWYGKPEEELSEILDITLTFINVYIPRMHMTEQLPQLVIVNLDSTISLPAQCPWLNLLSGVNLKQLKFPPSLSPKPSL